MFLKFEASQPGETWSTFFERERRAPLSREMQVDRNEQLGPGKPRAKTIGKDLALKHFCNESDVGV